MSPAPAVIFLHIPKTGGLTLRHVLARQAPADQVYEPHLKAGQARERHLAHVVEGADEAPVPAGQDRNRPHAEAIAAMGPERVAEMRIAFGHFWYGIHQALEPNPWTYVSMLRDPVDRVLSLYQHRVEKHGLTQSVEEYVAADRDPAMRDGQTRRLVGSDSSLYRAPVTDEMLAAAKAHIEERFAVVGLTERFDESVVLLGRVFGWSDVRYVRRNVRSDRPRRESLSSEALEAILDRNRHDAELYRFAADRFQAQVDAEGPGFAEEVARFQERNARYQRVATPRARMSELWLEKTMPARRALSKALGRSK